MAGITIKIVGIEKTTEKLKNISKEKLQKVDDTVKKSGFYVQAEVQASVAGQRAEPRSVATGAFANSITLNKLKDAEYKVFTDLFYAIFLEFGTSKSQPRMHFRNTLFRNQAKIKRNQGRHGLFRRIERRRKARLRQHPDNFFEQRAGNGV